MKQLSLFDFVEIALTRGVVALVDQCDADLLQYKWCITNGYAMRAIGVNGKQSSILMHRAVFERVLGRALHTQEHIDHINGVRTDNRRLNLRVATQLENTRNRGAQRNNKSGYKGVSFDKYAGRWVAHIRANGKTMHIGYYDTPEEAARVYNEAAIKYFGEFARLNDIP